jgi:hypothetical protein
VNGERRSDKASLPVDQTILHRAIALEAQGGSLMWKKPDRSLQPLI